MQRVMDIISDYEIYLLIALIILVILLIILVITVFATLNRVDNKYRRLMRGTNNKNLEELLVNYSENVEGAVKASAEAKKECEVIRKDLENCIQKVSIKRYKAFDDVGSDLSYSIALLDENNDGILLTGIYARYETTTYAKPINKGISKYDLSEEEKDVLEDAISK